MIRRRRFKNRQYIYCCDYCGKSNPFKKEMMYHENICREEYRKLNEIKEEKPRIDLKYIENSNLFIDNMVPDLYYNLQDIDLELLPYVFDLIDSDSNIIFDEIRDNLFKKISLI